MLKSIRRVATLVLATCAMVLFFPTMTFVSAFREMMLPPMASRAMAQPDEVALASVVLLAFCVIAVPIGLGVLSGCNVASVFRNCAEFRGLSHWPRVLYISFCLGGSGLLELMMCKGVDCEKLASIHAVTFMLYVVLNFLAFIIRPKDEVNADDAQTSEKTINSVTSFDD